MSVRKKNIAQIIIAQFQIFIILSNLISSNMDPLDDDFAPPNEPCESPNALLEKYRQENLKQVGCNTMNFQFF